jgi:3'(2'), 5'-bisphosphate nucleotidase
MLEPVDGTAMFLRGEQYIVVLAPVEGGERVGILGCPDLNLNTRRVSETSTDEGGLGFVLS